MPTDLNLSLTPELATSENALKRAVAARLQIPENDISGILIIRKSVDARSSDIKINLNLRVFINEPSKTYSSNPLNIRNVANAAPVLVVGAGPAGLFASLRLIELGLKPVIIERGPDVSARKRDIASIHRHHIINADSNYCFGEGGAGTFSDGKLYTRSKKRGSIERILKILHHFGASDAVLYEAYPHIGTDKLPGIIANIRALILECGGEVHFNQRVNKLIIRDNKIKGLATSMGFVFDSEALVLATGHSARDVYEMLFAEGIQLESKAFAMGVRVEHPQELIDRIQYHGKYKKGLLPPSSYSLVCQVNGRGVYSFCMCPGGFIVPAATSANEVVVNGMSPSQRNSPFANSGIVVEIRLEDMDEFSNFGSLAGLRYQQELENLAWRNGNFDQTAPAQRLSDFIRGKLSSDLPKSSYIPGLSSSPIHEWLPDPIGSRLREALTVFGRKLRGFQTNDAIVTGVESRTSSPVRVPRQDENGMHPVIKGLFPCGEGAGYAGGIASSAMDGEKIAEKVALFLGIRNFIPIE
jgi:uncharacterized FAD-dependent dehydrogenase